MADLQTFLKTLRVNEVVERLHAAPEALAAAMIHVEETRLARDEAREDLRLAVANAEALAWAEVEVESNGKKTLAAERKAQIDRAVADSLEAKAAREYAATMEREYGLAQAELERIKAGLYAARALSELASATLNYVSAKTNWRK